MTSICLVTSMPDAIDDVLGASKTKAKHFEHLDKTFRRQHQNGLRLKPSKYEYFKPSLDFVGVTISANGYRPIDSNITGIQDFATPTTTRGLKRFLGMAGFYHRFVLNFSGIGAPLTDLTDLANKLSKIEVTGLALSAWGVISNLRVVISKSLKMG